jgi:hypothetical protein
MRLTITIRCTPKKGRADRLHDTITRAVRKHAKHKGMSVHTEYHQEEGK